MDDATEHSEEEHSLKDYNNKVKTIKQERQDDKLFTTYAIEFDNTDIKSEGEKIPTDATKPSTPTITEDSQGTIDSEESQLSPEPDVCTVSLEQKTQSESMTQKQTPIKKKPFECEYCKKTFERKAYLIVHDRIHTGDEPFECDFCNRTFKRNDHLMAHRGTHSNERSFECDICKKRFKRKQYLFVHKRVHTGEEPFECEFCKKKFTQRATFVAHKRAHTGERPFQCEICKKRFMRKGYLSVHKLIHSDESPFECEICKKRFKQSAHLYTHRRTHAKDKSVEPTNKSTKQDDADVKEKIKSRRKRMR